MNNSDTVDEALDELPEPAKARGRGRPKTLTLELFCRAASLIAKGLTEEQACVRVGINHNTFRTARHRYPDFETALKEAQAEFVDTATDQIIECKQGWQALAWILERRHGDQFRRNTGMELSGAVGTHNTMHLLLKKPPMSWTEADLLDFFEFFKALSQWPKERFFELSNLYQRVWGHVQTMDNEKLMFIVELGWRSDGIDPADIAMWKANRDRTTATDALPVEIPPINATSQFVA